MDSPLCVGEGEGGVGWACGVGDGLGFGLEAVDAGGGDWVRDVEETSEAGGFEAFGECALQAEAPVEGSGVERWDA